MFAESQGEGVGGEVGVEGAGECWVEMESCNNTTCMFAALEVEDSRCTVRLPRALPSLP